MKVLTAKVFYNKAFQTDAAIDMAIAARLAAGDGFTIKSITESIIRGEDFLDDTVKTIKRPTLIVWGREDGLVPLADGRAFSIKTSPARSWSCSISVVTCRISKNQASSMRQ